MAVGNGESKLDQIYSLLKEMEGVEVLGPVAHEFDVSPTYSDNLDTMNTESVKYGVMPKGDKRYTADELNTFMRTLYDQIDGGDFHKLVGSGERPCGYLRFSEVVGVRTTPEHETQVEFTEMSCSGDDHVGFGDGATTAMVPEQTTELNRIIDVEFYPDTETANNEF